LSHITTDINWRQQTFSVFHTLQYKSTNNFIKELISKETGERPPKMGLTGETNDKLNSHRLAQMSG